MNELPAPLYPLCDVAVITKRHVHDVRNVLNGMELELALLERTAEDSETREAVDRLRQAMSEAGRLMQRMSSTYSTEASSIVPALQIAERWRMDARHVAPDALLEWSINLLAETICGESGLIRTLLTDMLQTAASMAGRKKICITCRGDAGKVYFEISFGQGAVTDGIFNSHQAYWTALRRLAERTQGALEPEWLHANSFPLHLTFPIFGSCS